MLASAVALGILLATRSLGGESHDPASNHADLPDSATARPAPGMFLVARRALGGSHFGQSVIYLVEHGEGGTMGLIVNRPSDIGLFEAVPDLGGSPVQAPMLYYGGPVGLPAIFMLLRGKSPIEGLVHIAGDLYISPDRRVIVEALAAPPPGSELRFYLGYSGWAAGQLDSELEHGSWHVIAHDTAAIFSTDTDSLWDRLIERLEPRGIQVDSGATPPVLASTVNGWSPINPQRNRRQ